MTSCVSAASVNNIDRGLHDEILCDEYLMSSQLGTHEIVAGHRLQPVACSTWVLHGESNIGQYMGVV